MWAARDKISNALHLYKIRPIRVKRDGTFRPNNKGFSGDHIELSKNTMKDITWENSPQKINILSDFALTLERDREV